MFRPTVNPQISLNRIVISRTSPPRSSCSDYPALGAHLGRHIPAPRLLEPRRLCSSVMKLYRVSISRSAPARLGIEHRDDHRVTNQTAVGQPTVRPPPPGGNQLNQQLNPQSQASRRQLEKQRPQQIWALASPAKSTEMRNSSATFVGRWSDTGNPGRSYSPPRGNVPTSGYKSLTVTGRRSW
jgi:hypothetical protein